MSQELVYKLVLLVWVFKKADLFLVDGFMFNLCPAKHAGCGVFYQILSWKSTPIIMKTNNQN